MSLFVFAGYAGDVLDCRCESEKPVQVDHGKSRSGQTDDCQCLCHQIFSAPEAEPVRPAPSTEAPADFAGRADEFPPDAVPLGIDYPPQLA